MAKRRKRDYAAEYARRIARAKSKGYSVAIARGHPPKGVIGISLATKLKVPVGTEIADISLRDKLPGHPWEMQGQSKQELKTALRELGIVDRGFEYEDQEEFVKKLLLEYGFTYREAFDLYFGY